MATKKEKQCTECGSKLGADAPQGLCPQCLMKLGLPSGIEADKALASEQSALPTSDTASSRFTPPEPEELGKQFPKLEIIELVGQGGMGAVYKARQKQLDRTVALKILPPEVGQDAAFSERFAREARSLAKLNHPRIIAVFDFGHTKDGLYYFIMEFVDGTDLRHVIHAGELSPKEALAIVPQICEALEYAHEEGIVHRDIKPENILIDKKGRVKIADFGLAKLLDKPAAAFTLTHPEQRMGTPLYMAPEQIEHPHEVDHRADIYSLGVVFYEMLTRELPIGRFAPPSQKVQVDVRLDEIVLHTLEKEPARRYQHASEIKTDVETITASPKAAATYARKIPPARRFSRAAIVGACWAPLGVFAVAPLVIWLMLADGKRGGMQFGQLELIIMFPIVLLGLTAPIGTTILGIVAISHIRHSAGRLYGMGLALFDALLYPLLTLDIIIFIIFVFSLRILPGFRISPFVALGLLAVVLISLNILIVRWAKRKAYAGLVPLQGEHLSPITTRIQQPPKATASQAQQAGKAKSGNAKAKHPVGNKPKPAPTKQNGRSKIGVLSLCLAIGGIIIPLALSLVMAIFGWLLGTTVFFLLCVALFLGLEIVAFVTGIIGWRSACGKAGLIISAILLILSMLVLLFCLLTFPVYSGSRHVVKSSSAVILAPEIRSNMPTHIIINNIGMKLARIEPGEFMMGSPDNEIDRDYDESPQHSVKLTKGFYMGITEVTQGQWFMVMETNPWSGESKVLEHSDRPAVYISWDNAVEFCRKLSQRDGRTYRLPTEAEWEYACRAGTKTAYSFGDDKNKLEDYGWFNDNSTAVDWEYAQVVGQKKANPRGLFDMHGNVSEWCSDWYDANYYSNSPSVDPKGPATGRNRVLRGGSWGGKQELCRSPNRNWTTPGVRNHIYGFRVVLESE